LKQAVDEQRRRPAGQAHRFVVTGSSAHALRSGASESGQGRWDELLLEGLTFRELLWLRARSGTSRAEDLLRQDPQALDLYLAIGGLPELLFENDERRAHRRIRQDLADRAIAKDLAGAGVEVDRLRRLFAYAASHSGDIWNAVKRAEDLGADRKSVAAWLERLEGARLLVPLQRRHGARAKAARVLRSAPKVYAFDHGVARAFSTVADDPAARVYETVVFRHLRALGLPCWYFREGEHYELDFVLDTAAGPVGIEVTSSAEVRADKVRAVEEAGRILGAHRLVLVHGGLGQERRGALDLAPLHEFLLTPERWVGTGARS
jgi:predicted AAA+ superfamily ATPase